MISDGDFAAACDLRDLIEPARAGDRAAALQLRKAERWVRKCLADAPPLHQLDAWLADHGLPTETAADLQESGLPLLALELGWRRAAQAARPAAPSVEALIEAADAADKAMQAALKMAKTVCRKIINQLNLTEIPPIGSAVAVGRRHLELMEVSPAGRMTWLHAKSGQLFTSGRTGRLRPAGFSK